MLKALLRSDYLQSLPMLALNDGMCLPHSNLFNAKPFPSQAMQTRWNLTYFILRQTQKLPGYDV